MVASGTATDPAAAADLLLELSEYPHVRLQALAVPGLVDALCGTIMAMLNGHSVPAAVGEAGRRLKLFQLVAPIDAQDPCHGALTDLAERLATAVERAEGGGASTGVGVCTQVELLGALAAVSRLHMVQVQLQSRPHSKRLYRKLIECLSSPDLSTIVYALSVLSSLLLYDEAVGEKLFNPRNIDQTFALVFNLIAESTLDSGGGVTTESSALLLRLCEKPEVRLSLMRYPALRDAVSGVLVQLGKPTTTNWAAYTLLNLMARLCHLDRAATAAANASQQGDVSLAGVVADVIAGQRLFPHVLKWCYQRASDGHNDPAAAGRALLRAFVHAIPSTGMSATRGYFVDAACTVAAQLPDLTDRSDDRSAAAIIETAAALAWNPSLAAEIAAETQKLPLAETIANRARSPMASSFRSGSGALAAACLELLWVSGLSSDDSAPVLTARSQTGAARLGANPAVLKVLGAAIAGGQAAGWAAGLRIAVLAGLTGLPLDATAVADVAVNANASLGLFRAGAETPNRSSDRGFDFTVSVESSKRVHVNDDPSGLAARLTRGLQLSDLKASEVLQIYESKFKDMTETQNRNLSLLDAKTKALDKADALLVEYRSKTGTMNDEFDSLRHIVRDAEVRAEDSTDRAARAEAAHAASVAELQAMTARVTALEVELEPMKVELAEMQGLQQRNLAMELLVAELKDHLVDRDLKFQEQTTELDKAEVQLAQAGVICDDMKAAVEEATALAEERQTENEMLRAKLVEATAAATTAQAQVQSTSATNAELSAKLVASEAVVESNMAELTAAKERIGQLEGIATMIHNLSSGASTKTDDAI